MAVLCYPPSQAFATFAGVSVLDQYTDHHMPDLLKDYLNTQPNYVSTLLEVTADGVWLALVKEDEPGVVKHIYFNTAKGQARSIIDPDEWNPHCKGKNKQYHI